MPIVVIGAYWSTFYLHRELANPDSVKDHRLASYFLNSLAFGQLILVLGLMFLSIIRIYKSNIKTAVLITWFSIEFLLGMYLSIPSGYRTCWLVIPIVFLSL